MRSRNIQVLQQCDNPVCTYNSSQARGAMIKRVAKINGMEEGRVGDVRLNDL